MGAHWWRGEKPHREIAGRVAGPREPREECRAGLPGPPNTFHEVRGAGHESAPSLVEDRDLAGGGLGGV